MQNYQAGFSKKAPIRTFFYLIIVMGLYLNFNDVLAGPWFVPMASFTPAPTPIPSPTANVAKRETAAIQSTIQDLVLNHTLYRIVWPSGTAYKDNFPAFITQQQELIGKYNEVYIVRIMLDDWYERYGVEYSKFLEELPFKMHVQANEHEIIFYAARIADIRARTVEKIRKVSEELDVTVNEAVLASDNDKEIYHELQKLKREVKETKGESGEVEVSVKPQGDLGASVSSGNAITNEKLVEKIVAANEIDQRRKERLARAFSEMGNEKLIFDRNVAEAVNKASGYSPAFKALVEGLKNPSEEDMELLREEARVAKASRGRPEHYRNYIRNLFIQEKIRSLIAPFLIILKEHDDIKKLIDGPIDLSGIQEEMEVRYPSN
jgi:hypothetical protein